MTSNAESQDTQRLPIYWNDGVFNIPVLDFPQENTPKVIELKKIQ